MSALPIHEEESVITEFPKAKGPGARLKSARVAKNLDIKIVAAQLHLSDDMIIALEADDFDQLPARVFVVGYLKNYARHVGLPVEAILKAFEDYHPVEDSKMSLPKPSYGDIESQSSHLFSSARPRSSSSFIGFFGWLVLLLLVGGYFAWSKGLVSMPSFLFTDSGSKNETTLTLLPEKKMAKKLVLTQSNPSQSAEISQTEKMKSSMTITPSKTESTVIETITVPAIQTPIIEAPAEKTLTDLSDAQIVFTFKEACWVDIRDSSGNYRYVNQVKAGTTKKIGGKAPYKILLGNASGVRMTINGEPFDLQAYTKANVARFTLDL